MTDKIVIPLVITKEDSQLCHEDCIFLDNVKSQLTKHGIKTIGCNLFNTSLHVDDKYNIHCCDKCFSIPDS